jgi:Fe2+ transport system protein B
MGFGCNAAGVVGTRIIESPRERIIASVTNSFVPCNGRYPFLIAIATIFIAGSLSRNISNNSVYFSCNFCNYTWNYFDSIYIEITIQDYT